MDLAIAVPNERADVESRETNGSFALVSMEV